MLYFKYYSTSSTNALLSNTITTPTVQLYFKVHIDNAQSYRPNYESARN